MEIQSFTEVRRILEEYAPLPRALRGPNKLDTMRTLMEYLGNPQESCRVIHVAGTSGKTSTAYYIAAMLTATGKKVGLTVSPHSIEVNERAQINMVPLDEARYCQYFGRFIDLIKQAPVRPAYFELLIAFAFWVFVQEHVEYAVVEVGVGGLLDATNIVRRHDKVCVITDIGLDHTETLGNTIAEITAKKAGIIQPTNTVLVYDQGEEVMNVIREVADQQQAELHEIWPLKPRELPTNLPLFQRRNWYLAWSTAMFVIEDDALPMLSDTALAATSQTYIPGRMEIIKRRDKTIVLDGAHNAQKLEVLASSLKQYFPGVTFAVLLGLVKSKSSRLRTSVQAVTDFADHLVITSYDVGTSFRRQSSNPARIAEQCHLLGYDAWEIVDDPFGAYKVIMERPEEVVVITGSFFMIDQLRQYFYRKHHSPEAE